MDVKIEIGNEICQGCLSKNRRMLPIGELEVFYNIMMGNNLNFDRSGMSMLKMCWECAGRLRSLKQFRDQLYQAQNLLLNIIYKVDTDIPTLSNLSTVTNKTFNHKYKHKSITKITDNTNTTDNPNKMGNPNIMGNPNLTGNSNLMGNSKITDNPNIMGNPNIKNNPKITDNLNITDNSNKKETKPKKITIELQPIVKLENPTEFDLSEYNDNDYYDNDNECNELLPDLYNTIVKEEIDNDAKKVRKKKNRKKSISTNAMYFNCYTVKKGEAIHIKDKSEVDKYFTLTCLDETEIEELVHKKERENNKTHKLKCEVCKLGFLANVDHKRHVSLFHQDTDKPKRRCVLCKINLPSFELLRQHWKKNHSHYYQCVKCNEYVRKQVRLRHLKFRHTNRICCKGCKREFPTRNAFFIHYKKEHGTYICDYCGKTCQQKHVLAKHIDHKHQTHSCPFCCTTYKMYRSYMGHMAENHPEFLKKKVDKESAFCVECNRQFPTVSKYRKHLKESVKHGFVRKTEDIPCPECGKIFKRVEYMRNHLHQVHMPEKAKYYCAICNKIYSKGWGLKIHNMSVHMKVPKPRDKICDLCGRGFTDTRILVNHRRTHTGERPFKCTHCSAAFAQKIACVSHMKTQHRDMNR